MDTGDVATQKPCAWYLRPIIVVLVISLLLGSANGMTSAIFANLSDDQFGNSSYRDTGIITGAKSAVAVMYTPIIGSLTDSYGRRPVILCMMSLNVIPYVVMTVSGNFLAYLLVEAAFGLLMLTMSLLYAMVGDLVPAEDRGRTLANSFVLGMYMLGILCSFIGDKVPTRLAFAGAGLCLVIGVVVGYFYLPHTGLKKLDDEQQQQQQHDDSKDQKSKKKNRDQDPASPSSVSLSSGLAVNDGERSPLLENRSSYSNNNNNDDDDADKDNESDTDEENKSSLLHHAKRAWHLLCTNKNMRLLCLVALLNVFDQQLYSNAVVIYLKNQLGFTKSDMSTFLLLAATGSICCCFIVVLTSGKLRNVRILILSLAANALMSAGYAFVKSKIAAKLFVLGTLFALVATPTVSSLGTQAVDSEHFGVAQGILASARVVSQVIAPLIYGVLFEVSKDSSFPGWPFLVGMGLAFIAMLVAFLIDLDEDRHDNDNHTTDTVAEQ